MLASPYCLPDCMARCAFASFVEAIIFIDCRKVEHKNIFHYGGIWPIRTFVIFSMLRTDFSRSSSSRSVAMFLEAAGAARGPFDAAARPRATDCLASMAGSRGECKGKEGKGVLENANDDEERKSVGRSLNLCPFMESQALSQSRSQTCLHLDPLTKQAMSSTEEPLFDPSLKKKKKKAVAFFEDPLGADADPTTPAPIDDDGPTVHEQIATSTAGSSSGETSEPTTPGEGDDINLMFGDLKKKKKKPIPMDLVSCRLAPAH